VFQRALGHGFGVRAADDGVVIMQRGRGSRRLPRAFYSFAFSAGSRVHSLRARAGNIELVGDTIHPGYGWINAARPAIEVESYWRAHSRLSSAGTVQFAVSPVYNGARPTPPAPTAFVGDTPTLDWLPMSRWPRDRTVHVASLPLLPPVTHPGKVDIYIRLGCSARAFSSAACPSFARPVRLGTVEVRAPG
jgi:hypothetical protein